MEVALSKRAATVHFVSSHETHKVFEKNKDYCRSIIAENVVIIAANQHQKTGLFPASNPSTKGLCDFEHHYEEAWVRDSSFTLIGLMSALRMLEARDAETIKKIGTSSFSGVTGMLHLFGSGPWSKTFKQKIEVITTPKGHTYTRLTEPAPPVHMKTDGSPCKDGKWDHNQPESFAEFLIAASMAQKAGIVQYDEKQIKTLKSIADYLVRIQPWKFESAAMWEGLPSHNPSSRSTALIIAKGLEHSLSIFEGNVKLQRRINKCIEKTLSFVKGSKGEDYLIDYTKPKDHPNGIDLAMIVALTIPSQKTTLPFLTYTDHADKVLGNGHLPGKIRHWGDDYHRTPEGEAVWFMGLPLEALGYYNESLLTMPSNPAEAADLRRKSFEKLRHAIEVGEKYGYYPELFTPRKKEEIANYAEYNPVVAFDERQNRELGMVPKPNDLLWNRALMIQACTAGLVMLDIERSMLN